MPCHAQIRRADHAVAFGVGCQDDGTGPAGSGGVGAVYYGQDQGVCGDAKVKVQRSLLSKRGDGVKSVA